MLGKHQKKAPKVLAESASDSQATVSSESEQLLEKLEDSQKEVRKLENQLVLARKEILGLNNQLETATKGKSGYGKYKSAPDQSHTIQEQALEIESLNIQLKSSKEEIASLHGKLQKVRLVAHNLENDKDALSKLLKQLQAPGLDSKGLLELTRALENQDKTAEKENISQLEKSLKKIQDEKDALARLNSTLQTQAAALQKRFDSLLQSETSIKTRVQSLETERATLLQSEVSLKTKMKSLEAEKATLLQSETALKLKVRGLDTERTTLQQSSDDLREKVNSLENHKHKDLQKRIADLEHECADLQAQAHLRTQQAAVKATTPAVAKREVGCSPVPAKPTLNPKRGMFLPDGITAPVKPVQRSLELVLELDFKKYEEMQQRIEFVAKHCRESILEARKNDPVAQASDFQIISFMKQVDPCDELSAVLIFDENAAQDELKREGQEAVNAALNRSLNDLTKVALGIIENNTKTYRQGLSEMQQELQDQIEKKEARNLFGLSLDSRDLMIKMVTREIEAFKARMAILEETRNKITSWTQVAN